MRIMSQNRRLSIEFEQYDIGLMGKDIFVKTYGSASIHAVIGRYETEDRAREVFNKIHDVYGKDFIVMNNVELLEEDLKLLDDTLKSNQLLLSKTDDKSYIEHITNNNYVFYMPEK